MRHVSYPVARRMPRGRPTSILKRGVADGEPRHAAEITSPDDVSAALFAFIVTVAADLLSF
eukprot:2705428-Prymnesium_polylepis.1